jgi:hypothetical protein
MKLLRRILEGKNINDVKPEFTIKGILTVLNLKSNYNIKLNNGNKSFFIKFKGGIFGKHKVIIGVLGINKYKILVFQEMIKNRFIPLSWELVKVSDFVYTGAIYKNSVTNDQELKIAIDSYPLNWERLFDNDKPIFSDNIHELDIDSIDK